MCSADLTPEREREGERERERAALVTPFPEAVEQGEVPPSLSHGLALGLPHREAPGEGRGVDAVALRIPPVRTPPPPPCRPPR